MVCFSNTCPLDSDLSGGWCYPSLHLGLMDCTSIVFGIISTRIIFPIFAHDSYIYIRLIVGLYLTGTLTPKQMLTLIDGLALEFAVN